MNENTIKEALEKLLKISENISNCKHAGIKISNEQWSDLYSCIIQSKAILNK